MKFFLVFMALFVASCATINYPFDESMSFQDMEKIQKEQEGKPWSTPYLNKFLERHNKYWITYSFDCSRPLLEVGVKEIEFIFPIGPEGKVLGVRSKPDVPEAECFLRKIAETPYPTPPVNAYYAGLRVYGFENWKRP